MNTQEAINHYEYGISHDIFKEPVTTYARLAVEALREKQEREKGCNFCKYDKNVIDFYTHTTCDEGYIVEYHETNICPMCGRDLRKEQQE